MTANHGVVPALITARVDEVKGEERREREERVREGRERAEREQLLVNRVVGLEDTVREERRAERRMWEERLSAMKVEWDDAAPAEDAGDGGSEGADQGGGGGAQSAAGQ